MYSDESDLEEVSAVLRGSSIWDEVFEQMAIDFFISFLFFSKRCVQILIINRYNKNHSGIYKILKKIIIFFLKK